MTGWQRFFLLVVFCVATLIFWPQYDNAGLTFLGMFFLLWTCIIILFSILINLFAIYKIEFLHRLLSLLLLLAMVACLLVYFPLPGEETPLTRIQNNQWPTVSDVQKGIKRLTFNFDFVHRNANNDDNYINQKFEKAVGATKDIKKTIQKKQETIEELVVELEDEK